MRIGISAPISLSYISEFLHFKDKLPKCLESPLIGLLVLEYLKQGHEVVIFTLDSEIEKELEIRGDNVTVYIGKYRKIAKVRAINFFHNEIKYLRRKIEGEKLDIIHSHWTYEFSIANLLANENKNNKLITVHDWSPKILDTYKDLYRLSRYIMDRYVFKKGKYFTAVSPYIKERVEKYRGRNCELVPNFIEKRYLSNDEKKINDEEFKIIAINNGFNKLKNTKIILTAFKDIKNDIPKVSLIMVGKDYGINESAYLWAEKENLSEGVQFLGSNTHDKTMDLLSKSHLFIHTSLEESFGSVIIEAMAKKVPVIAGKDVGAIPWILNNGEYGILVDVNSKEEIKEAILKLYKDKSEWKKYSDKGRNYVEANFTLESVANKYLNIYKEIIQKEK